MVREQIKDNNDDLTIPPDSETEQKGDDIKVTDLVSHGPGIIREFIITYVISPSLLYKSNLPYRI